MAPQPKKKSKPSPPMAGLKNALPLLLAGAGGPPPVARPPVGPPGLPLTAPMMPPVAPMGPSVPPPPQKKKKKV